MSGVHDEKRNIMSATGWRVATSGTATDPNAACFEWKSGRKQTNSSASIETRAQMKNGEKTDKKTFDLCSHRVVGKIKTIPTRTYSRLFVCYTRRKSFVQLHDNFTIP